MTEAAQMLGVGRRTIMGYLKKDNLPAVVTILIGSSASYPFIVSFTASTSCFNVNGFGRNANWPPAGKFFSKASSA